MSFMKTEVLIIALFMGGFAAHGAESRPAWQLYPSLALTEEYTVYMLANAIFRAHGKVDLAGVDIAGGRLPATAGLCCALEAGAGGPSLNIGALAHWKGFVTVFNSSIRMPREPLSPQWRSGVIGSPGLRKLELADQSGDWTHQRVVYAGEAADDMTAAFLEEQGEEPFLSVTVSRLCPGVLIETSGGGISLFQGGGCQADSFAFYAASDGKKVVTGEFTKENAVAPCVEGGWLLIYWGVLPPKTYDLGWNTIHVVPEDRPPILMVFDEPPFEIEAGDGLCFRFASELARVALMPLYGFDFPGGEQTRQWRGELPGEVARRCDEWAARLAMFPLGMSETYEYDAGSDTVTVRNRVADYVRSKEGAGRKWTPVPPMLALARDSGMKIVFSAEPEDCGYRTVYGPLAAVDGADELAWSASGLAKYVFVEHDLGPPTPQTEPLERELAGEFDKFAAEPYLAPWIYEVCRGGPYAEIYWRAPTDTACLMAGVVPALDAARRARAAEYLRSFQKTFPFLETPALDSLAGPKRTRHFTGVTEQGESAGLSEGYCKTYKKRGDPGGITFAVARGLADYFAVTGDAPSEDDWAKLAGLMYDSFNGSDWATGLWTIGNSPELPPEARSPGMDLELPPKIVNRHIGDLAAFLRLSKPLNKADTVEAADAWGRLARELATRLALEKYAAWAHPPSGPTDYSVRPWAPRSGYNTVRTMDQFQVNLKDDTQNWRKSVYIRYLDMPREVGLFLRDHARTESEAFLNAVDESWPFWWIANMTGELGGDGSSGPVQPANAYSLFMARAWILGESGKELEDRLDVSWLERGDLFYMHKLAETIVAYRGVERK